jgi:hypothetical protein
MTRILILGLLLWAITPTEPAAAMCGFWTNCPATNTWQYDQTICSDNPKHGYSTVFVRCYTPAPAPVVVYVAPRTYSTRYYRRYYATPHHRTELRRYHHRAHHADIHYHHRHPKAAEARAEHHRRVYHKTRERMRHR